MRFSELLAQPLLFLAMPEKRIFFGYMLTAFLLAVVILKWRGKKNILHNIFNKKVWLHPSAKLDYQLFIFNIFIRLAFLAITTVSSLGIALLVVRNLQTHFSFSGFSLNYHWALFAYTICSFVILDFSRFLQHYFMHKIPFLWQFHKIHHSAEVLTPLTLYRTHPVESLISLVRRSLVMGGLSGVFIFLTQSTIGGFEVVGVNIFDFAFNIIGSNLRHSHIWWSFGPLNYLLISPAQHQIHHSQRQEHFDKNFGIALSLWDLLFGSFYNVSKKQLLRFGIKGEKHHNLQQALLAPFGLSDYITRHEQNRKNRRWYYGTPSATFGLWGKSTSK